MGKNKLSVVLIILLLIGVSSSAYLIFGPPQMQFDGDQIWKPRWGSLGCIKDDSPEIIGKVWLDQETLYKCGDNYLVDDCDFEIENTRGAGFLSMGFCYSVCDLNGDNCFGKTCEGWNAWSSGPTYTKTINAGQSLLFSNNRQPNHIAVTQKFYPYRLWTEEGGGHWISRSADCSLADQDELVRNDVEYGDWKSLDKTGSGKYINYVIDWIPAQGGKIYNYQGDSVICSNNILYELDVMKMSSGVTYNMQGDMIKGVQCCPHQTANCDSSSFTFLPADKPEERECTYNYECENGGIPTAVSDILAVQEKCIDGECTRETLTIECGSDAKCRELYGDNYVCDLTFANFGKCIQSGLVPQAYCGDGICQTGETSDNCAIDCTKDKKCEWYQDEYEIAEKDYGAFYWRAIFTWVPSVDPIITQSKGCRTSGWVYMLIVGGIAIIISTLILFASRKGGKR